MSMLNNKIKMIVCDMAGTIINEKGIIYKSIFNTLQQMGINNIKASEMNKWHGRDKSEVLASYLHNIEHIKEGEKLLVKRLDDEYFGKEQVELIDSRLFDVFDKLRSNDIKVCLNTGYPERFQKKIIKHFNLNEHVDDYISSEEVLYGRPYPFMIHRLMERNTILCSKQVIKIGDTVNDIKEGKNAKCGVTIGVLTGADSNEQLANAGADIVLNKIVDIENISII